MGLDYIILIPISLIKPQLKPTHSSLLLKTTDKILVEIKLEYKIELMTTREFFWNYVQDYQHILTKNKTIDTRVIVSDINRDESIYGPRVDILKGKMFRKYHSMYRMFHTPHCAAYYYTTTKMNSYE